TYMGMTLKNPIVPSSSPLSETLDGIRELSKRIAAGEPLQLVVGNTQFFGRAFAVRRGVFIPRPETETLVEVVVDSVRNRLAGAPEIHFADIGTGTGAVAVTLLLEIKTSAAAATDTSPAAAALARENAAALGAGERITVLEGDLFQPLCGELFDCVVSNPPYVRRGDIPKLDGVVRDYDPAAALDGGEDGLDFVRAIATGAADRLKSGGLLAMEIGIGQAEAAKEILRENGYERAETKRDLQGVERVITGWKK
ncbi:peptide chain release factor N(5)-glutamine methyltransferase, partial [Patescibacteria group bacterium]|nr:peptide chain release factor N(5)-glutamine methyltransferase [Patescibacteria group bacterium]